MKLTSTRFSPRRRSAGLSLGLFLLVALAATTTTRTYVFADGGEVDGGPVQASEETPRPFEPAKMSSRSEDYAEQGFLSPTKPSSENERKAENEEETSMLGGGSEASASPTVAAAVIGRLPQRVPGVNDGKIPQGSGRATDKGSSDAEQLPVPASEEGKAGNVSNASGSSPPMASATAAAPHDRVESVRTMDSVRAVSEEGVQDHVPLSSPVGSPPMSVEPTITPATASLSTVRATAMSAAGVDGWANAKPAEVESSQGSVEAHSHVAEAGRASAPAPQGSGGSSPTKADGEPVSAAPLAPGRREDEGGKRKSGSLQEAEARVQKDSDAQPPGVKESGSGLHRQGQDAAPAQQQQQPQQQQGQSQDNQAGESGSQTPPTTSSTTPSTTTTSDSTMNKKVWCSILAMLTVLPLLVTA